MSPLVRPRIWILTSSIAALILVGSRSQETVKTSAPVRQTRVPVLSPSRALAAEPVEKTAARPPLETRLAAFLKMATHEQDNAVFEDYLNAWIADLTPSEIPVALAFAQRAALAESFAADFQARLVRHWADKNPTAALVWISQQPPSPARTLAFENIAIVRSRQDLAAASEWASQLPAGPERNRILAAVANEAIRLQPAAALRLAADLPATPANDDLIRRAAMEWTAKDQPRALDWAKQISDDSYRAQVLAGVAVAWGDRDPIAASRLVLAELPAGRQQDDAIVSIAQRWAQQSPEAAARWIAAFPEGNLKEAATKNLAAIWAQSAPQVAARWKASQTF